MISKEEMVLYPTSLQLLDVAAWTEIRRGESEIGYCLIDPPAPWSEVRAPAKMDSPAVSVVRERDLVQRSGRAAHTKRATRIGTVDLDGGALSPEEINLLLRYVPFDITYVDEYDEVRFYNKGTERVFPRSAGIIGREVRYCHPPKSVHIVVEIVSEFKAGNRDTAEFWIQMRDSFVHIRYFAVRDDVGAYRGVIEVSQDVKHLRRELPQDGHDTRSGTGPSGPKERTNE